MSISPSVPVSDFGRQYQQHNEREETASRYSWRLHEEESRRSRKVMWASLAVVGIVLVCGGAYGLTRLGEQGDALARMDGWKLDLSSAQTRVGDAEKRIAAFPNQIQSVRDGLMGLERKMLSGLDQARRSVQDLGASLRREIRDARNAVDAQARTTDTRFREVEAARRAEELRTAQLEREVAQLNQRLTAARSDLNSLQNASATETQQLRQDLRNAGSRLENRITNVASFSNRPRGRFEAGVGRTIEIAPKMLLHVSRVDPRYRRWHGYLQLVDEGKFVWLRDQSVSQTVPFYVGKNALRYDLVATGLSEGGVAGYLILPSVGELEGRSAQ